jgi:AraC family transcriptional regulator
MDPRDIDWGRCSDVSGVDGDRLLQPVVSPHVSWSGLPIVVQVLPGNAVATDFHIQHASLALARTGRGKRRYSSGRRSSDLYSSPSMFELYAGGYCIDHASWDGVAGEVISVQFPALQVNRLLHAQGRGFELPIKHELFDSRIADLTLLLWDEARQGGPRGRLYGDGISLALLGLLVEEHGACTRPGVRSRAYLAPAQMALIRDYIDEHLCADLCVEHLAALVGISAAYFSRSFKASFGVSPHAYVTERRLCIASRLLQQDKFRSLADIATGVGFSSQSHFTESFRRKMGVTPGRWRQR